MRCPRCDLEIPDRSVFCFNCGVRVSSAQPLPTGAAKASFKEPEDLGSSTLVDLSRKEADGEVQYSAPTSVEPLGLEGSAKVQVGKPANTSAQTAPFEPSPLASVPSLASASGKQGDGPGLMEVAPLASEPAASSWGMPSVEVRSSWSEPGAPPPIEEGGSRWEMPSAPQGPETGFLDLGSERPPLSTSLPDSSSVSMVDLELRLSRRRQRLHWVLWALIVVFLLGAIYFFLEGLRTLRSSSAGHTGDGRTRSSVSTRADSALAVASPIGEKL
jgi:hypothetical protein